MPKPTPDFDLAELVTALRESEIVTPDYPGWITCAQLEDQLGWPAKRVRRALRACGRMGKLETIIGRKPDLVGRRNWCPYYRLRD